MEIETLGDVWAHGGQLYARCLAPNREGLKSVRRCGLREEIDLRAMLWTRGRDCPVSMLSGRFMKCPSCGCRDVAVSVVLPSKRMAAE